MENYHLYRIGIWLAPRLPLGLVYFVAGMLAEMNFLLNTRSRRGVYANQRHVLPADTGCLRPWRTARAAFRNFGYAIVDFFLVPSLTAGNANRYFAELRGWEHLETALQTGRGALFVTVHMGSWELAGAYLGLLGLPLTVAALAHRDKRIDEIFRRSRESTGMEVVQVGGALRKLADAVRRGRFVGLLADRDTGGHGPLLPFFGEVTHMPDGHARIALETGATMIPCRIFRLHNWRLVIDFRAPVPYDPAHDSTDDLTLRCITYLEDFIRDRPEQWFSFYDQWSRTELPVA